MSDADRERELRRLERDRRRRERGGPTYFSSGSLDDIGPDDPTAVLRPDALRRDAGKVEQLAGVDETVMLPAEMVAADAALPGRRLAVSTAIFGAATALSRLLGLVREVVAAYYFGVGGKINAFTVAFQVPNLVRALVADAALSSAFVPVFVDLLKKDPKRAWRVASSESAWGTPITRPAMIATFQNTGVRVGTVKWS